MQSVGYTFWREGEFWLGQLDDYPDYMTQGTDLNDLREHLLDLYRDLNTGVIKGLKVG